MYIRAIVRRKWAKERASPQVWAGSVGSREAPVDPTPCVQPSGAAPFVPTGGHEVQACVATSWPRSPSVFPVVGAPSCSARGALLRRSRGITLPAPLLHLQRLFPGAEKEQVSGDEAFLGALWEQVGVETLACVCGIFALLPGMGEKGQGGVQFQVAAVGGYAVEVAQEAWGRLG